MHLSLHQLNRYRHARLAAAELLVVDDHLVHCEFCRQQLRRRMNPQAALLSLQTNLQVVTEEEHLSSAQLTAFRNNSLSVVERELIASHLEFCSACATQLQTATETKATRAWWQNWRERMMLVWPIPVAAAIVIVVVAIADYFYFRPRTKLNTPEVVQRETAPKPSEVPLPSQPESKPELKTSSAAPIEIARLTFPAELAALRGEKVTRGEKKMEAAFRLTSPVGTVVLNTRPTLRWQALAGATSYTVKVFSTDYDLVTESPALKAPTWTLPVALKRGKTYLWQVTAKKNEEELVAASSAAEAKFAVLDAARAQTVAQATRNTQSALALGLTYAQAGLLDEAEAAFRAARNTSPQAAKKLLQQLQTERQK